MRLRLNTAYFGKRAAIALAAVLLLASFAPSAWTQAGAIKIVVPYTPGSGPDILARLMAEQIGRAQGATVVVENRPGGGTVIGTDAVAKAEPDGYTMLLGASANLAFTPGLYANLPYDPKRDFIPIGLAATFSYTLVARNDLPPRTLADIVGYARANPAKLNYASAGNGTGQHICAALLWHLAGVSLTHVPYKGAQAVYQDLIPGRVDLFCDASSTARVQLDAGRVRAIAVSGPVRLAYHPEVPTVRERTVDAAGTTIFVRESGSGSPVVLLHGFPETSRCWDKVAGALSAESARNSGVM